MMTWGHVVFHGLNHHLMLQRRFRHLHAARTANGRMGISPSPAISLLVSTITTPIVTADTGRFTQQRGLTDTGTSKQ
ncbi:MAG: hypothetical protein R2867_02255 [Caldilineaceae bacterium]